jgi:beta-alanine--pyruvate transaminase
LKGAPNVIDIRTIGLVAAVELASKPGAVGARAYEAMERGFNEFGLMMRIAGDTIALSPPLVISQDEIGELVEKMGKVLRAVG